MHRPTEAASNASPSKFDSVVHPQKEEPSDGEVKIVPVFTPEQERKLWRRIDLRLLPIITVMYLFSFMDRGVVVLGNAKLDGLVTQLNLTGNKFNIALTVFFIPFSLFEFPSNLVIQVIRPSRQVPTKLKVLWGIVMTLMGFVKTYPQLVGVRVCLGVAEAGIYPGVALTMWYPRYMYQYRFALFCGSATLAGAFSGLLAYAINFMSGDGGLEGWSWIFIIEGLGTVVVGFIAFLVMVDYPSTAKFLTAEERAFVIQRQLREGAKDEGHHVSRQVWAAFTDWQVWALSVVQISVTVPLYGITYFLPFGYSTSISQLLTIPPYAIATVVLFTFAYYSDKLRLRSPFVLAGQIIALIGFIINISNAPSGVKYFGTHLCVIGSYVAPPGAISWLANNLEGRYKRSVGMALQIAVGNLGGAVASNIFRTQDAPRYVLGHGLEIMFLGMGLVALPVIVLVYKQINAQRDLAALEGEEQYKAQEGGEGPREVEFIGDRDPSFRYTV
ncbi:MFS general substrate transporter [Paxillus ammoniavirescens]|nr:MFS general substrate transporter [Paxillus ammoniavirescens]